MLKSVGIRAIAVDFPSVVRTNDFWRNNHPELVAKAEQKSMAKAFSTDKPLNDLNRLDLWTREMLPYLKDPFRGGVERRVLGEGESSLTLEYSVAKKALDAAGIAPEDIDLMLVSSMFPETVGQGNAAFLAGRLGLQGAAWNLSSMCSSALVALQTASTLVKAGEYKNVLVVTSCTYSRFVEETDTLAMSFGDGAGAFVVGAVEENRGILGSKIVHTASTCGAFYNELTTDKQGKPKILIRANKNASKQIPSLVLKYFKECCHGVLNNTGISLDEIDFFVCFTATAWYANFFARALGIEPERTIDLYPQYGNISSTSVIANLYRAAELEKIEPDSLVLVYSHGFAGSAAAIVMRWGDVALGCPPVPSTDLIRPPIDLLPEAC